MRYLTIKLLNDDTIQKIAAGEVVERPSSIIKELVENSIDAGANEISVSINKGGKDFIKVTDNGCGIEKDQAQLAFARHATSKIQDFDDLYKIFSMGFRGEALASIVAVARVNFYSKTQDDASGINLIYDNNKLIEKKSVAMNRGTIIEVTNLFEYIPVRKKFLGSDIAEGNKITAMMYSFAIANTGVSISYTRDDRLIFATNKNNTLLENLRILFGKDYVDNVIHISNDSSLYKISGYISNNMFYKGNRSMQYIFVNGRYIDNSELTSHIESQYHTIIPNGRFPAFQIFIKTDPKNIDINISPNKQKIKFNFADELFENIKTTVLEAIIESQKIKEIILEKKENIKPNFYDLKDDKYKQVLDNIKPPKWTKLENKADLFEEDEESFQVFDKDLDTSTHFEIIDLDDDKDEKQNLPNSSYPDEEYIFDDSLSKINNNDNNSEDNSFINEDNYILGEKYTYLTTIFNKYLLYKNNYENNNLLIINQRAAKDRLIYDRLSNSINEKKLVTTDLLVPIIIELSPRDYTKYIDNIQVFKNLGYEIDDFGANTIAIRSLPYIIDTPTNKAFFMDILDEIEKNISVEKILEIFKKRALVLSSNKAKFYTETEAMLLLDELENSSNKFSTAHGSKIQYNLSLEEFERILKS